MTIDEFVFRHFKDSPGLEAIAGPWLDEIPADQRSIYPHCVAHVQPTSGVVVGALTGERFETLDYRFETFVANEKSQADEISAAVKTAFSGVRFSLGENYFLGTCRQTARFVRYSGRDNSTSIWVAVNGYRLTIQDL